MRILIDTNTIIQREDNKVINQDLQLLLRLASKLKISILVHPKSIDDIHRDKNERRKTTIISKFKTYERLEDYPDPKNDKKYFIKIGTPKKINDIIDDFLIYAVYKDAINFLITEDLGIHKKSILLGIQDRVFTIADAIHVFKKDLPTVNIPLPPIITQTTTSNIDLNDNIFDSLRAEYPNFNDWFKRISQSGRKCWVYTRTDDNIGAILIYKFENEPILSYPPFPKRKRLKIATMKVSYVGYKIGELLLKLAIELAIISKKKEIYLTHFTKEQDFLVDLIEEYGFEKVGVLKNGEDVFLKEIFPETNIILKMDYVQLSKKFYPTFYDGPKVKKHIIPIQPQFHKNLFIDSPHTQTKSFEIKTEGNTIRKAYLCHSNSKKLKSGDIILFYRSIDIKGIVSLGIVENVYFDLDDPNRISNIVGKRTVYSISEIQNISKSPTIIILFNYYNHLKTRILYDKLIDEKILNGFPQSITEITHESYLKIKKLGGIDERFTVN